MTEIQTVIQDFNHYLQTPITNSHDLKLDQTAFQDPAIQQLLQYAIDNQEKLNELLTSIALVLPQELDIYKKGLACLLCGTLIEFGGDPEIVVDEIVQQLEDHLSVTQTYLTLANQEGFDTENIKENERDILYTLDSDAVKASTTVSIVVLATMTSICRVKEARQELRQNSNLIQQMVQLEDDVENLSYLQQVMYSADEMKMIVLHPESQTGLYIQADMIQNNFHLFTLLQGQYLQQFGHHPAFASLSQNETAIRIAKGEDHPQDDELTHDYAHFGFYDFAALHTDGKLSASIPPGNWLFGEGTLHHIPKMNGIPIVLLGPNML